MLIQELKEIVADQLVTRHDFREVPLRVEYSLARFGQSLVKALHHVRVGSQHMKRIDRLDSLPPAA